MISSIIPMQWSVLKNNKNQRTSGLVNTWRFGESMEAPRPFLVPCLLHLFHLAVPELSIPKSLHPRICRTCTTVFRTTIHEKEKKTGTYEKRSSVAKYINNYNKTSIVGRSVINSNPIPPGKLTILQVFHRSKFWTHIRYPSPEVCHQEAEPLEYLALKVSRT